MLSEFEIEWARCHNDRVLSGVAYSCWNYLVKVLPSDGQIILNNELFFRYSINFLFSSLLPYPRAAGVWLLDVFYKKERHFIFFPF